MSGLYVRCGSFEGSDKSASALDEVLDALVDAPEGLVDAILPTVRNADAFPTGYAARAAARIRAGQRSRVSTAGIRPVFDDCYVSISNETAALLLPHLRVGRAALVARLGHDDSARADREARAAVETGLRRGAGWRLWCFDEVILACETSAIEHEPVVFYYF